jgi:hypothetical protein
MMLFNTSLTWPNSCFVNYDLLNNVFGLLNDANTEWLGPLVPGSLALLENSQCRILGVGTSATGSGNQLTLNLAVSFKASYLGLTNIYMAAEYVSGAAVWLPMGTWTVSAPQAQTSPSVPSPGNGSTGVAATPALSWAAVGASWYDVYFGTSTSPTIVGKTATPNFSPGTLAASTKYYWKVVARSLVGDGASPVWSFTTAAGPDFSVAVKPSSQTVPAGTPATYSVAIAPLNGFSGAVSLAVPAPPIGFSASFNPASVTGGSGTAVLTISSWPSLDAGTYSFTVKAVSGILSHSVPINLVLKPAVAAPSGLSAAAVSSNQVKLTWNASSTPGASYNVYRVSPPDFTPWVSSRIATGVSAKTYSDIGLSPATTYYYVVSASTALAESSPSNVASATTLPGLSCHVDYTVNSQWNVAFDAGISIKNTGTTPINGWSLGWTWSGNQQITQAWNSTFAQHGANAMLSNASWNATVVPGDTIKGIGFNASYSGTNRAPSTFSVNGTPCK